jgi:hypothetical protein
MYQGTRPGGRPSPAHRSRARVPQISRRRPHAALAMVTPAPFSVQAAT